MGKLLSRLLLIWYNPMTESDSKLRHILGTFFPLYSSMSKPRQLAMEAAFIPTMKVLFDAPVTSPLNEIDTEDVGMFFVHLTREDMLQSYDGSKKDGNIIESSTTTVHDSLAMAVCNEILSSPNSFQIKTLIKILTSLVLTHNNYVHLRELKVLAELLLQNVKEKSCVRSLERFDKQLQDWLVKDPSNEGSTPGANKRKSKVGEGEESLDKSGSGAFTPTRGRKRILFSRSMTYNSLLNPESGHVLETTYEEATLLGTTLGKGSFIRSPMNNTKLHEISREEDGDTTLVDDGSKIHQGAIDVEKDGPNKFISTESSPNTDDDDTESHVEEIPKLTRVERVTKNPGAEKSMRDDISRDPRTTNVIEVLLVSDEEDDIFSDASSVASVSLSKLPPGSLLDDSSEDSLDEDVSISKSSNSHSILSVGSSRSSVNSSTPRSNRGSRASRAASSLSIEMTTPPTVRKKEVNKDKNVKNDEITLQMRKASKSKAAPPRIDYKTEAILTAEDGSKGASPNLSKALKTPVRKRRKAWYHLLPRQVPLLRPPRPKRNLVEL